MKLKTENFEIEGTPEECALFRELDKNPRKPQEEQEIYGVQIKRRRKSAEERAKIREYMKRYWAKRRKREAMENAQGGNANQPAVLHGTPEGAEAGKAPTGGV